MNIVLIAPPMMDYRNGQLHPIAQDETRNCPPYGLYLLASILRKRGQHVTMVDLISRGTKRLSRFRKAIANAGLIGIGATSMSWPTALEVIREIRTLHPDTPIVLGGIHATMFDRYLLQRFPIDFVIRGEGEVALPLLCEAVERHADVVRVPNLSWKAADSRVMRNPLGPKIDSVALGSFPLPAYEDLPPGVYKGLAIESSRGCAFDCSFCSTSYRKSWRGIPPQMFVDRLEALTPFISRTVYRSVHIIDDEFSLNPRRAIAITKLLRKRGLKLGLVYDSRANDLLYDGYVEAMADFTHQFLVGAECGYDEGLALIGKGTTCAKLEAAARELQRHGLAERADFSFILGLPWEGGPEVRKTIDFASHLFGEYGVRILLQWYCQIPGSRLWETARRELTVTEAMYDEYGFFRNLHLWASSIRLSAREIWEIEDIILQLQVLAHLAYPSTHMIEHAIPEPLAMYFPRTILSPQEDLNEGLGSLREVSHPLARVGITQRHTYPPDLPQEDLTCLKHPL